MSLPTIQTIIGGTTNNTITTIGDLQNFLDNLTQTLPVGLSSDQLATFNEEKAIAGALADLISTNSQLAQATFTDVAGTVPPNSDGTFTLPGSDSTVYTTSPGQNLAISAESGGHVNLLLGNSSILTLIGTKHTNAPVGSASVTAAAVPASFNVIVSGGDNSVTLNRGPSTVTSTVGNDVIVSHGGKDTITGGSGHDTITAGGQSFVQAGSSGDTITGGLKASSHDTITGGSGQDQIVVAHGNNLLVGGSGLTYMQAGDGLDTIQGGSGHQTIWGSGSTYIEAGKNNKIHAQGADTVIGGSGRDTIFSTGSGQLIQGGKGHLEINVSKTTSDTIFGGSGQDVVHINQSVSDITSISTVKHVTNITFANGQTLQTENVTIDFKDHHK